MSIITSTTATTAPQQPYQPPQSHAQLKDTFQDAVMEPEHHFTNPYMTTGFIQAIGYNSTKISSFSINTKISTAIGTTTNSTSTTSSTINLHVETDLSDV